MKKKVIIGLIVMVMVLCVCLVACDPKPTEPDDQTNTKDIIDNVDNAQGEVNKLVDRLPTETNEDIYCVTMLIKLNIDGFASRNDITTDEELAAYREEVANYYKQANQAVVEALSLDDYDYTISYFAPYVELSFDNIADYRASEARLKNIINNNEEILSATVSVQIIDY